MQRLFGQWCLSDAKVLRKKSEEEMLALLKKR